MHSPPVRKDGESHLKCASISKNVTLWYWKTTSHNTYCYLPIIVWAESTQRCWHQTVPSTDGSSQPVRWTRHCLFALKEGHRERGRERGWSFLAIPRHFNGVFQFAVAGNERKLKPGQLFIPEKRSRLEEKAERRGGVWRWMGVGINR